jgi:hypothetical protein
MNPRIREVTVDKNFTLRLLFTNGEEKKFDVTPYLEIGVFKSLKNIALFSTAHAENGTVVWNNNVDFDPDRLYLESQPLG